MGTYTFRGREQSLSAWSRELAIPESTLRSRLDTLGLSVDEAFTRPVDARFHPAPNPPPAAPPPAPKLEWHRSRQGWCRWTEGGRRAVEGSVDGVMPDQERPAGRAGDG